jgi:hypothetical protein
MEFSTFFSMILVTLLAYLAQYDYIVSAQVGQIIGGNQGFRRTPTASPTAEVVNFPVYTKDFDCEVIEGTCAIECDNGESYDMVDVATVDGGFNQRYYEQIENSTLHTTFM